MKKHASKEYAHFFSPYFAVAFARACPMIGYLGVESGGRGWGHMDQNLLRSGLGGVLVAGDADSLDAKCDFDETDDGVTYRNVKLGDATLDATFQFIDERTLRLSLKATGGKVQGGFFRISFAPDVTPANFWAQPKTWEKDPQPWRNSNLEPLPQVRPFHMPGLVSLPDYGLLELTSPTEGLTVTERLVPNLERAGLNLGCTNTNDMTARVAYHHGCVELTVESPKAVDAIELTIKSREEIVPKIAGYDFDDATWAGLKRGWMNNFTLNPATLSLGDNFILNGLGHLSIHWKSDVSVFTPELLPGLNLHHFFRNAVDRSFVKHTDDEGKMTGYGWENGACNLIALHAYMLGTGDWELARTHHKKIRKVIEYNLSLDQDDDGILEASYHGNDFHGEKTSLNWWDAFAFGHKDAYGNLVYYQAFRRIREVLEGLGDDDLVEKIDAFLTKAHANFHKVFYNQETGVYAGWISQDGNLHDYYFTFITAMAINEGFVNDEKLARDAMQKLLDKLDQNGYGDYKYGVPGPAAPVDVNDRTDWAPMADWGRYENGGFCGQTAYHFILALYNVGMREEADRVLFNMLAYFEEGPTHSGLNPGFCKSWDWRSRDGQPCGYNYLADNYVYLLAAVQGHFGVELPKLKLPAKAK